MKKPNFIETQKFLKILKKNAPEVHFTRNFKGQFIAAGGGAGVKFTLPAGCPENIVAEKARRVDAELRAVWKDKSVWGVKVDAKTHELKPRKTD